MDQEIKKIVIAGDVTVDWLMYPVGAEDEGENWRLYAGMHSRPLPGGALLLARFLKEALAARPAGPVSFEVYAPQLPENLGALSPEEIIHSNTMLKKVEDKEPGFYRVEKMLGYIGPKRGLPRLLPLKPKPDPETADILVLDDAGNHFRDSRGSWPVSLAKAQNSLVVYKLSRPLARGALWEEVRDRLSLKNVLVIANVDDFRQVPGVNISKSLSWERTAADFMFYLYRSEALTPLQVCPCLVVLCGTEGAILYYGGEEARASLIFDPHSQEGWQAARLDGQMMGLTALFTATLTAELAACGPTGLETGIKRGLVQARRLLETGYTGAPAGVDYPLERLFRAPRQELPYVSSRLSLSRDLRRPDPDFWRILDQNTRHTRPLVAADIVRCRQALGLMGVPIGTFGMLETIDRREIESYSAIRELQAEFLADPQPKRPLCFAVFGPPGSGKSFGVKQVVESLGDNRLKIMTFNISQFREYQDLVAVFHKVRDVALSGKVPLVLFDEFDCTWEGQALGWLKYFLAPMQDGEFIDGGTIYHLGKTILVFVGGSRHTYEDFTRELRQVEIPPDPPAPSQPELHPDTNCRHISPPSSKPSACCQPESEVKSSFRDVKGPDFVSRLRGFINIMGPNRQYPEDNTFVLRRAKILRTILRLNPKSANLFDSQQNLRLDESILRAFLHVSEYRHGTRSMEAIIEMSRLAESRQFDLAALPPRDQLNQHVDAEEFMWLTERERFQSLLSRRELEAEGKSWHWTKDQEFIEQAAGLLHQDYVRHRELEGQSGPTTRPFDELTEDKKQSNRDAAEDIPHKLKVIGHGLRRLPPGKTARPPDISDDEIWQLAVQEHKRWCREQRLQGWCYGLTKDPVQKTTPYLVPFDQLADGVEKYNLEAIYAIPLVLQKLGFEVYRLEEADELEDPYLVERLARIIHGKYVKERKKEGQTLADNPNLLEFDELPDDIKDTNLDQAYSIPHKLRHLGYSLRRFGPEETSGLFTLSRKEVENLAKMEHARWNWQKMLQGWIYGKRKNKSIMTHNRLVPWDQLPKNIKKYDRQTVRLIPQLLQEAGYEAYRANE